MIKYLLKKWIYIPLTIIIYLIFYYIFELSINPLEPLIIILIVRLLDDYFDFKKDKGKRLDKKGLIKLTNIFIVVYVILEIILYSYYGLLCLLLIAYMYIMNKKDILKIFLFPLILSYYYIIFEFVNPYYLIMTFIMSICYYLLKRCKHDIRK